jgi:hypothetical protein
MLRSSELYLTLSLSSSTSSCLSWPAFISQGFSLFGVQVCRFIALFAMTY